MAAAQGGVSIARSRNGDRFYTPPAVRKQRQQMLLLQQQKEEQQQRDLEDKEKGITSSLDSEKVSEDCSSTSSLRVDSVCSISRQEIDSATNLDRFLQNTTPVVPSKCFSKKNVRGRRSHVADSPPYFILGDLWDAFQEWSAYGAGVPILLNDNESVVQYYVPSLSAIQLFVSPTTPSSGLRRAGEDSDVGSSRETSSEGSCDRDAERGNTNQYNRSRGQQNVAETDIRNFNRLSLKNVTSSDASGLEGEIQNTPGPAAFEFFERESPFVREPLANKISTLASRFPGLKTYRSCDLLPQSWLSVAWYPIYRIPTGPTLKNLDACFLTYHSLSTPLSTGKDVAASQVQNSGVSELYHPKNSQKLTLPTFALASYRLKASVWESDCQKEQLLLQAAGNWLKLRQVEHPDYGFFMNNYISPLLR